MLHLRHSRRLLCPVLSEKQVSLKESVSWVTGTIADKRDWKD